jgi:hypothetical protein
MTLQRYLKQPTWPRAARTIHLIHYSNKYRRSCFAKWYSKLIQLHQQICFTSTATAEAAIATAAAVPNTPIVLSEFLPILWNCTHDTNRQAAPTNNPNQNQCRYTFSLFFFLELWYIPTNLPRLNHMSSSLKLPNLKSLLNETSLENGDESPPFPPN